MSRKSVRNNDGTRRDPAHQSLPITPHQEPTNPHAFAPRRGPHQYVGGSTIGVRLRRLRASKGWSKGHLAALLSMDPRTVSAVENGACMWSSAAAYAQAFQYKLRPILARNGFTSAEIGVAARLATETVQRVLDFIANDCKGDDISLESVERVLFATASPPIDLV